VRILSLDPGESTGYALLHCSNSGQTIQALDYGVIVLLHPGDGGLVRSICDWLEEFCRRWEFRPSGNEVVFEDYIRTYKSPRSKESIEAVGAVRLWCENNKPVDYRTYTPQEWRSAVGLPLKGPYIKRAARQFVSRCLGYLPNGADHGWDALAIGIVYAIQAGAWRCSLKPLTADIKRARIRMENAPAGGQVRMSTAEFRELVREGRI